VSPLNAHPNAHGRAGAYTNAAQVSAALDLVGARAAIRAVEVTRHHTMLLETRIKAKSPTKSGDYRRSWQSTVTSNGSSIEGTVGTNRPQARRLEYGFVGADRLGRVYNQRPRPHLGPAWMAERPQFTADMAEIATWGD
jgi:hypothetical protein